MKKLLPVLRSSLVFRSFMRSKISVVGLIISIFVGLNLNANAVKKGSSAVVNLTTNNKEAKELAKSWYSIYAKNYDKETKRLLKSILSEYAKVLDFWNKECNKVLVNIKSDYLTLQEFNNLQNILSPYSYYDSYIKMQNDTSLLKNKEEIRKHLFAITAKTIETWLNSNKITFNLNPNGNIKIDINGITCEFNIFTQLTNDLKVHKKSVSRALNIFNYIRDFSIECSNVL